MCNVGFFADLDCETPPSPRLSGLLASPSDKSFVGSKADRVYLHWASACSSGCEDYVGVTFSDPVSIRCVRAERCGDDDQDATNNPPSSGGNNDKGDSSGGDTNDFLEAAHDMLNPHFNFSELEGGMMPRRLQDQICDEVVLQRSDSGTVDWTLVAAWKNPMHGASFSLKNASERAQTDPPKIDSMSLAQQSCVQCGVKGVKPSDPVTIRFTENVFPGTGKITFQSISGGVDHEALDRSRVNFNGKTVIIRPRQAIGPSGKCAEMKIKDCPIVDADGECYVQKEDYNFCIRDYQPPRLKGTRPYNHGVGTLKLDVKWMFDEPVSLDQSASPLKVTVLETANASFPKVFPVHWTSDQYSTSVWEPSTGAVQVEILLKQELPPESAFRLEFPGGAVIDRNGNPWPGSSIWIYTPCRPPEDGGCLTVSSTSTTQAAPKNEEDQAPVFVYIAIAFSGIVLGAGTLWLWRRYLRRRLHGQVEDYPGDTGKTIAGHRPRPPDLDRYSYAQSLGGKAKNSHHSGWDNASGIPTTKNGTRGSGSNTDEQFRPHPNTNTERRFSNGHTDESMSSGGWVKNIDVDSGKTFWQHYKTKDIRWEPPRSKFDGGAAHFAGGARARQQEAPPRAERMAGEKSSPPPGREQPQQPTAQTVPEVKQVLTESEKKTKKLTDDIFEEMRKTHSEDLASRKKTFKLLILKWHPDKNQDCDSEVATQVFQFLQEQKDWYLRE